MCATTLLVVYLIGLIFVFGTWFKPPFFWVSNQCLNIRRRFGDRGAEIFYYSLGGLFWGLTLVYFSRSLIELIIVNLIAIFLYYLCNQQNTFSCRHKTRSASSRRRFQPLAILNQINEKQKYEHLRRELLKQVPVNTAERLIDYEKNKNPGKTESWYWDKVIYDLKRGR